jgi:FKBP-type peptidyl-prolyl cis-trans isomerase SlyD
MTIKTNSVVSMNYTLKDEKGNVIDTSDGRSPLVYLHGAGGLIPGLENELDGKTKGDKLNVVIAPEDAYGTRKDELFQVVPKAGFQGTEDLALGMQVQMETEQGPVVASVSKIEDEDVTLDLNHPLADITLHFDVEVVEIRDASADEITHGHVHGEGEGDH